MCVPFTREGEVLSPALLARKKRDAAFLEWRERTRKAKEEQENSGTKRQATLDFFASPAKKQKLDEALTESKETPME